MSEHPTVPPPPTSHLFTLRVWVEECGEEQVEWRGRIHHVESNQTRYFRAWSALLPVLMAMVRAETQAAPRTPPPPDSPPPSASPSHEA